MKRQDTGNGGSALAERLQRGEKLDVHELLELMDSLIAKNDGQADDAVRSQPER